MTFDADTYLANARPLFICGLPKTGTTLLLSLLDSHPDVLVFPEETKFLRHVIKQRRRASLEYLFTQTDCGLLADRSFASEAGERDYTDFDARLFRETAQKYIDDSTDTIPARPLLESLMVGYGAAVGRAPPRLWVEKTPLNELRFNVAAKLWPKALAIYVARDPRDVFCSYNAKRRLRDAHEMSVDEFEIMMNSSLQGWSASVRRNPLSCAFVRYEDLVTAPDNEMRRLAAFLSIPFTPSLLRPTRRGQKWTGNSMHVDGFDAISATSVGAYKDKLDPALLRDLEACTRRMLKRFDYLQADASDAASALVKAESGG